MNLVVRELNFSPLIAKLKSVMPEAMRFLPEIVTEQARLMVSSDRGFPGMCQIIPPAHAGVKNAKAGKHGEKKVASDISRVYLSPSGAYADIRDTSGKAAAKAFYAALKGRNVVGRSGKVRLAGGTPEDAERILRQSGGRYKHTRVGQFDGGTLHRSLRLRDGTIGKKVLPRLVVLNPDALALYIKKMQGNVGIMASAFNRAGSQFNAKGMAAYITRHGDRFSSVQLLQTKTAFWITMTPRLNFGGEEIDRRWDYVLRYRLNAMDTKGFITRLKKVFLAPASTSLAA